jgi:tetratricopeptide (TPR) repeat protein
MLSALALCFALLAEPADAGEEARALFEEGQAKYETHDYDGAIEAFTSAYAKAEQIEDAELRDEALARLGFNLARAHVSAYDIDHDAEHLSLARRLVADFRGHERALGRDPDTDTDLQRLEAELAKRERELDETENAGTTAAGRKKRIAGITLLGLAAPFAGLAVTGGILGAGAKSDFETVMTGDARRDAQSLGRTSDLLFGLGIGLAVVSAATGATLLGLSAKAKKAQVSARATLGGFVLEGKF